MRDTWLDLVHGGCCVGCGRAGRSLCPGCLDRLPRRGRPARPTPCPPGLAACAAAGEYDGLLRALVLAHKEQAVLSLAAPLGGCLATAARVLLGPAAPRGPHRRGGAGSPAASALTVLVPVPSPRAVVRRRGHDPVLRMARRAAAQLRRHPGAERVEVLPLLTTRLPVADQSGLDAAARASNRSGTPLVRPRPRRALVRTGAAVRVLVVDDVLTTGATVREAQRALEDAGVPVAGVAVVAATRRRLPVAPGRP